jgi:hypothetical protein
MLEEFLCFSLPRFSLACPLLGFCTFPFCVDSEFPSPSKDNISNAMPFSFPLFVTLTPVLRCSPSGLLLLSCRSYVSDPLFPPLPPPPCPFPGADILRLSRCSHFPVPRPPSSGETLRFFFSCLRFFFRSLKMSKMRRRSTVPNEGCHGHGKYSTSIRAVKWNTENDALKHCNCNLPSCGKFRTANSPICPAYRVDAKLLFPSCWYGAGAQRCSTERCPRSRCRRGGYPPPTTASSQHERWCSRVGVQIRRDVLP